MTTEPRIERAEHWLEKHSGWGQLLITLISWAVMAVWMARGLQDQADSQARINQQLIAQFGTISDRLLSLSLSTERLSEHMAVYELDSNRRIDRLERAHDGGKQ